MSRPQTLASVAPRLARAHAHATLNVRYRHPCRDCGYWITRPRRPRTKWYALCGSCLYWEL